MAETVARKTYRAAVVYQPHKTKLRELWAAVNRCESDARWVKTLWFETEAEDAGYGAARRAIEQGASVVLASGGDGTIRAVAEALRGTGVPLAVIPQGTGNLLARNLGMPLGDLDAAVRAAFEGEDLNIDLGIASIIRADGTESEHVFLVLAGMGLDARAISATRATLKKRLGWLAYVDAGLRALWKLSPLRIRYAVDGAHQRPINVYTVMIGNCGLMPGGVLLIPDAKIDDGLLDIVVLRPLSRLSWLRIGHKIAFENGVLRRTKAGRRMIDLIHDTRAVGYVQARDFSLSVAKPEPVQLDGDDFGLAIAINGSVDAEALTVRMLADWKAAI